MYKLYNAQHTETVGITCVFQSLPSGEEEHSVTIATSSINKAFNRFKNITVCEYPAVLRNCIGFVQYVLCVYIIM